MTDIMTDRQSEHSKGQIIVYKIMQEIDAGFYDNPFHFFWLNACFMSDHRAL